MNAQCTEFNSTARRRHEARIWHLERRSHLELPPVATRLWQEWIADPANAAEYEALQHFLTRVQSYPAPPLPTRAELLADTDSDWPANDCHTAESDVLDDLLRAAHVKQTPRVRPRVLLSVGCAAVAAALAVVWVGPRTVDWLRTTPAPVLRYETTPGKLATVTLEDLSVVNLAGGTRLQVQFSSARRRVVLEQGEVLLQVAHQPGRPFEVQVDSSLITVLGTTFDVHRYRRDVEVAVTAGAVKVSRDADPSPGRSAESHTLTLHAGQQVEIDAQGQAGPVHSTALDEVTSWLYGGRLYRGKPLVKVIEDMQLYLSRGIDLDPDMNHLRFTGRFDNLDSAKVAQWVHGLPEIYPIAIDASNPRILRFYCRTPSCTEPTP